MKLISIFFSVIFLFLSGFYIGNWANNKQRLEDEAFYLIQINRIYQENFDLNKETNKNIALLIKTHTNRYLNARGYSLITEEEDSLFCQAFTFTELERARFNQLTNINLLNNYLKEKIDFCGGTLDFIN